MGALAVFSLNISSRVTTYTYTRGIRLSICTGYSLRQLFLTMRMSWNRYYPWGGETYSNRAGRLGANNFIDYKKQVCVIDFTISEIQVTNTQVLILNFLILRPSFCWSINWRALFMRHSKMELITFKRNYTTKANVALISPRCNKWHQDCASTGSGYLRWYKQ